MIKEPFNLKPNIIHVMKNNIRKTMKYLGKNIVICFEDVEACSIFMNKNEKYVDLEQTVDANNFSCRECPCINCINKEKL